MEEESFVSGCKVFLGEGLGQFSKQLRHTQNHGVEKGSIMS